MSVRIPPALRALAGMLVAAAACVPLLGLFGRTHGVPMATWRLVPEDASGRLRRIAIHYSPALDDQALPVWRRLFAVLPGDVEVAVAVTEMRDFDRFLAALRKAGIDDLERFRAVPVHRPLTTWSRDRMAALAGPIGEGAVLAPPRIETASATRAGDWQAPFAVSRAVYRTDPQIAGFVFEGGDLAASSRRLYADANLLGRNLGRGDASRETIERELRATFAQEVIFLGDAPGEVPIHHVMMYMVPLDDDSVMVGDVRLGQELLGDAHFAVDPDVDLQARRFDRVAELLAARGLRVTRMPVVVLPGGGSYVTYTNALFDRDQAGPVVYLPTYQLPALDAHARRAYEALGYRVIEIDVSTIYKLNGSLGCLVNVMRRDPR